MLSMFYIYSTRGNQGGLYCLLPFLFYGQNSNINALQHHSW